MCRWRETYHWKALDESYNFALDLISIKGVHTKLLGPKVGTPATCFKTKCHLDVGLVERHKAYYKGEGGGFPQVWAMINLVSSNLPMVHPNTKSVQAR
jgi:hypothetical protein